jgi:hypothetical protein
MQMAMTDPDTKIPVFYTPRKQTSVMIDPTLLAAAEMVEGIAADPNLRFLTNPSPIRSSHTLPAFDFERIPRQNDDRHHALLAEEPETDQSAALQSALSQSLEDRRQALVELTRLRCQVVLLDSYVGRIKGALHSKEKKKDKESGRLVGDGLPRLLTGDEFVAAVKRYREALRKAEEDKRAKAEERDALKALKDAWKTEQAKIDAVNQEVLEEWKQEVRRWEDMRDGMKEQGLKRGWGSKPKRPNERLIPSLPRPWMNAGDGAEGQDVQENPERALEATGGNESGEEDDEDDGSGRQVGELARVPTSVQT